MSAAPRWTPAAGAVEIVVGPRHGASPSWGTPPAAADPEPWTTAPSLGTASTYAALCQGILTADGAVMDGDAGAVNSIVGTISHTSGSDHSGGGVFFTMIDALSAGAALDGYASTGTLAAALGGQTVGPGVWDIASNATIAGGTTLTLDGGGRTDVVWVFRVAGSVALGDGVTAASVVLTDESADAGNRVYFRADTTARLWDDCVAVGTWIADGDVTVDAVSGPVRGRVWAIGAGGDITINGGSEVDVP